MLLNFRIEFSNSTQHHVRFLFFIYVCVIINLCKAECSLKFDIMDLKKSHFRNGFNMYSIYITIQSSNQQIQHNKIIKLKIYFVWDRVMSQLPIKQTYIHTYICTGRDSNPLILNKKFIYRNCISNHILCIRTY